MEIFIKVIIFIMGLCCGSFVNMLVYRVAVKYKLRKIKFGKLNKNRSECDFCGKQLSWYENVPVVSWLIQKGKSRCCRKPLPVLYLVVELMTGVLFLINGTNWLGMAAIIFLVFSAVFDSEYTILPDFSSYILIFLATINLFGNGNSADKIISGIGSLIFIWVLTKIRIKGKQAMGDGDILLAGFMGLWLGWQKTILAFYIAFIVGALIGLLAIILKKKKSSEAIPFGPFLILGTLVSWWWGETVIKLIISYF